MANYNFTGNPFVDTGLSVLVARARESGWVGDTLQELTPHELQQAIGDGTWLAQANRRLKAFSMVVGNNSPLTNTSSNPSLRKANRGKLNAKDDKGFQEYVAIVRELVSEVMAPPQDSAHACECCGMRPPTRVLAAHGKELGRDWFPLAGSLGSDAQALPAGSRTPQICSLCLLAIQLLPLGVTLLHGKLACFQSTSWEMTQQLTEYSYYEMQAMLAATASNDRLAALGAKGGTTPTTLRLLQLFGHLRESRRMLDLPAHVTMNVWLFSNSGTGADCDLIEIPNRALTFLWEAARQYRTEVEILLRHESKSPKYLLLECIRRQSDYKPLYPSKNKPLTSKGLFELYQAQALGVSPQALRVAEKMASWLRQRILQQAEQERATAPTRGKGRTRRAPAEKFLQQLTGRPFCDLAPAERNAVRRMLADAAEDGVLTLEEYVLLFPCETLHPLRTHTRGWFWLWFYLNHESLSTEAEAEAPRWEDVAMFTHPKIKQFARDVFDDYAHRRGLRRVKRDLLERFRRGAITVADMQQWFCGLAEIREGYTNEAWDDLCRDEQGNNVVYEVRFQLRLELANLYRQAIAKQ